MKKRKIIKNDTISHSPVIFCLRIKEPPLLSREQLSRERQELNYEKILEKQEFTGHNMTNDLLKSVIDKIEPSKQVYDPYVVCFWCCHQFDTPKCVLPISYDSYKNVYTCEGNFCSPQCALSYNYGNPLISDQTCWNRHALLSMLYTASASPLTPAPPRSLLRMFGGVLSIEQYRNYVTHVNDMIIATLPPIRLVAPIMHIQGTIADVKKFVGLSNEVIENAEDGLRLKRSKPVNAGVLTLDSLTTGVAVR